MLMLHDHVLFAPGADLEQRQCGRVECVEQFRRGGEEPRMVAGRKVWVLVDTCQCLHAVHVGSRHLVAHHSFEGVGGTD